MRGALIVPLALMVIGCGSGTSPTTPSLATPTTPSPTPVPTPAPAPSRVTVAGTLTDTLSGASVGTFSQTVDRLPAQLTLSLAGFVTRQAWVTSPTPTVDLIPEAGFDLPFYRQLARDDFQRGTEPMQPLWVLNQAPAFYLEVEGAKGVSTQVGQRLEAVARRTVPALTGGRFQVTRWETGPTARQPQPGWIVIERTDLGPQACGRARVGATDGQIWLHTDNTCNLEGVLAHEIGHALGFFHVNIQGSLMFPQARASNIADAPTERERRHAAVAYARRRGNRDVDSDPQTTNSPFSTGRVVID